MKEKPPELEPGEADNIIHPIQPELKLVWHGLEIVVNNTRMTENQLQKILDESDDLPPAA